MAEHKDCSGMAKIRVDRFAEAYPSERGIGSAPPPQRQFGEILVAKNFTNVKKLPDATTPAIEET